ncbi:ABC transporter substrate-binding protein [Paenibacillus tarimensis]
MPSHLCRLSLVFIIIVTIVLSGCSSVKRGPSGDNPDETGESGPGRHELILAVGSEPESGFDPTTGWGRYGSPLFQSTLLKRDSDLQLVGDLAEGYSVSPDGLLWTVTLRKDVKFSDGMPLTAADVQYTFQTAAASNSVVDLQNLVSVEVPDEYTAVFKLKKAQSTFVTLLATLGIVPKHTHNEVYAEHPIGSGPYKLVQWDKGQQLIVELNRDYYGVKPYFEKLTFLFLEEDAAFAAAKSGAVDVAAVPAAFSRQQVAGMRLESLQSVDNRGIMFPYVKSGRTTVEGYAVGNDVTADAAIRKAVNTAMNRQALVEGILEGHGTPAYTVSDGLPWWNPDTVIKDSDMERAKTILSEGGWEDTDGDGIVEKDGLKAEFTLLYPSGDVSRQSLAIAAADMIVPAGINIRVEGKSWDELEKLMHSNAVLFGWGSHDPLEMYNLYHSELGGVEWFNTGYYGNPKVDRYLEEALAATDEDKAMELWKKAQWDGSTGLSAKGDAPWAWLVNINHLYFVKDKLDIGKQKIHPHAHGWPVTDNIEEWEWME